LRKKKKKVPPATIVRSEVYEELVESTSENVIKLRNGKKSFHSVNNILLNTQKVSSLSLGYMKQEKLIVVGEWKKQFKE